MKSMKKLVLVGLVLLASVMVLVGCKMEAEPEVKEPKVYEFTTEPQILTNYESPNGTGDEYIYVAFGDWPQTIKASDVTVDESKSKQMGMFTYYLGSDGNYYVEHKSEHYKVEPIVWRVLTKDYKVPGENGELQSTGRALLLAENILTGGIGYYVNTGERTIGSATVYANNYKYSTIRAWLNGKYEGDDTQHRTHEGKGFLQTAFTDGALEFIAETTVDNTATSTIPNTLTEEEKRSEWDEGKNDNACDNTKDKIFLLSEQEATIAEYGFAAYNAREEGNTRIRVTTDYAKATGADQNETAGYGGCWWLRSPYYGYRSYARSISVGGYATSYSIVWNADVGVVPALYIELQ